MRQTPSNGESSDMTDVTVSADFQQPAELVWAQIRDFCGVDRWLPGIERVESEDEGKLRRIVLPDGKIVLEREVARDEGAMTLSYTVIESPMPFTDYRSTMKVQPTATGCTVSWSASLVPLAAEDKVVRLVNGLYRGGLKGLEGYLGTQPAH